MKRAHWIGLGLGILWTGLFLAHVPGKVRPIRGPESGSIEKFPKITIPVDPQPAESGSIEKIERGFPIPIDPQPAESGSLEKFDPDFPAPGEPFPAESGSQEKPGGLQPFAPEPLNPPNRKTEPFPSGTGGSDPSTATPERGDGPESIHFLETNAPNLILPVVIFLAGLFLVAWSLFRMGLFNPFTANLWPKRLELCIEIALRTDDFMTAFHESNFSKCQMSLEALNHLNGRRSILLSNEINAAVNRFVEQAVDCKISQNEQAFQKELNRRYESVIEALRTGTRQEELTLEVLRSLTKAQGPHRRLRESSSEGNSTPNA